MVSPQPDWESIPAGFYKFWEDPVANPLQTPTGKLEFYSTGLAEHFPDDPERPPVPHWIAEGESHQETIGTERSKKYPLLVMSNHPRWGVHSQHDDVTWFREIDTCKIRGADGYQYHPLWMNPADAAARGIKHGDVVSIYNERGIVLAGAYVTERIIAGAVGIDHGAKYDPIVPGEIDRGGVINTIVPRNCTSQEHGGHGGLRLPGGSGEDRPRGAAAQVSRRLRAGMSHHGGAVHRGDRGVDAGRLPAGERVAAAAAALSAGGERGLAGYPLIEQPDESLLDGVRRGRTPVDLQIHRQHVLERTGQVFRASRGRRARRRNRRTRPPAAARAWRRRPSAGAPPSGS